MIPLQEQRELRELFTGSLKDRVKIDYFTQRPSAVLVPGREECRFCPDVQALLEELAHLSDLIGLTVHELGADRALEQRFGVQRVPATVIRGVLNRPVVYFGVPLGLMFAPLVETIVLMSQNRVELPAAAAKRLKRLRDPVSVRVFVSPDSEYCPPMVTAAFAFGIESKMVKAEAIEVAEFPRLAERYGVKQVPFTVINDRAAFPGAVEIDAFAEQIAKAATSRTLTAELPRSSGATPFGTTEAQRPHENIRPSGLIIPGRT